MTGDVVDRVDGAHVTVEYLSSGPPEASPARPRWLPWLLAGAAALVGVLAVTAVVADWVLRNVEMRALVSAVESSEQAMTDTQAAVRAAFAPYEDSEELGDGEQEELRAALAEVARAGAAGVTEAGDQVTAVRILPWHSTLREAQAAYLAHNRAWQEYLTAAAEDPAEFVVPQEAVSTTWVAAEPALRDALPRPALFDLPARIDAIFAEPEGDDPADDGEGGGGGDGSGGLPA